MRLLSSISSGNLTLSSKPYIYRTTENRNRVFVKRFRVKGREVTIFVIEGDNDQQIRRIRILIFRIYFEYQNLRLLLQCAQNPSNKIDHNTFDRYVSKKVKYYRRNDVKDKNSEYQLFTRLQSLLEIISPGEIKNLSTNLDNVRLQIRRNLLETISTNVLHNKNRFSSRLDRRIKELLKDNQFEEVFKLLYYVMDSTEVVILEARYNRLVKDELLGLIKRNESDIEKNKIVFSILNLMVT